MVVLEAHGHAAVEIGEAEVRGFGVEAGDLAFGIRRERDAVAGTVISLGLHLRIVGIGREALEDSGKKPELLAVVELETAHLRRAAVELGRQRVAGVVAVKAVVGSARHHHPARGVDEILDLLLEEPDRERAGRLEIIFKRQIEVVGGLGLQARVAAGDRLGVEVDVGAGNQLADARPADVGRVAKPGHNIRRGREFEMHTGQHILVVAAADLPAAVFRARAPRRLRIGDGADERRAEGPLRRRNHLQRTRAYRLRALHPHTGEHGEAPELHISHEVGRGNFFREFLVAGQLRNEVRRDFGREESRIRLQRGVDQFAGVTGEGGRRDVGKHDVVIVQLAALDQAELREVVVVPARRRVEAHHSVSTDIGAAPLRRLERALLLARAHAELNGRRHGRREFFLRVEGDASVAVPPRAPIDAVAVVVVAGDVGETGPGGLGDGGEIRIGAAVDGVADVAGGEPEVALARVVRLGVRLVEVPVKVPRIEFVDSAELVVERLRVLVGVVGLDVDGAVGHGAHGRKLVGESRLDASGVGGIARRIEGRDQLRSSENHNAIRVVVDEAVHGRTRVETVAIAELVVEAQAAAPARREEPFIGEGGLERVGRAGHAIRQRLVRLVDRVLRGEQSPVPKVGGDGELATENLRVGHGVIVGQTLVALVEGPRRQAKRSAQHPLLAVKTGLRNHVHRATDRVAVHVGRRGFDDFHALDGVGAHGLKLILARGAGRGRVRQPVAVHRDRREILTETADANVAHRAIDGRALDARQPHEEIGGITDEVSKRVGGDDVLNPRRQPLERHRLRVALALAGDHELAHRVDLRGQLEVEPGGLIGLHGRGRRDRVQSGIGHLGDHRAGRDAFK